MKECNRCLFTSDFSNVGEDQCNYCDLHDTLESQADPNNLMPMLLKVKKKGLGKKYDCIMGISGGLDSSTLVYLAVKKWGLKPLVIHFDNGWNNEVAKQNMDNLITSLGVDSITYRMNQREFDDLNKAFIMAMLPDADIPNDIAMTKLMYDTANKYGIKYILNGHCFRTEGSTPKDWTYMDAKYIQSVYKEMIGRELKSFPLFTFKDQLFYGFKGIKNVRPFHYMSIEERRAYEKEMIELCGWQSYGGKHCENIYTEFVGSHYLPKYHKIDKRIVYTSALIRSGNMTKEEGAEYMKSKSEFDMSKLGKHRKDIEYLLSNSRWMKREDFERYNFKKYRPFIWVLAKLNVVPYTFYVKYCK